jgi:iron complex transport system substrate-binding protein
METSRSRFRPMARLCGMLALILFASSARAQPVSAVDDRGRSIRLPAPAQRVISLAPHATELLYAAGGGTALVGAVAYSDYPPAARALPQVGDGVALDLERIAALHPDLIVAWDDGNNGRQLAQLDALHIPVFRSSPHHLDEVATSLLRLGALLGTNATARAAAAEYRHDISELRARYANQPTVSVFYQVWDQPLMTENGSLMFNDMLQVCGGRNVFAQLSAAVPTVSTEAVLAADPEAIVAAAPGATPPDQPLPSLAHWRHWRTMTAVARNNLFAIDGDLLSRPGPRVALGTARLCEDLQRARQVRPH